MAFQRGETSSRLMKAVAAVGVALNSFFQTGRSEASSPASRVLGSTGRSLVSMVLDSSVKALDVGLV